MSYGECQVCGANTLHAEDHEEWCVPVSNKRFDCREGRPPVQVVVAIEGGVVQSVSADDPSAVAGLSVVVVDYDTDGSERHELTDVKQEAGHTARAIVTEHWLTKTTIQIDLDPNP